MIINSIRIRLQLWLAFMLVCLLSGFGFTAYQLQRGGRMNQIDDELEQRLAALNKDVRGLSRPNAPGAIPRPFDFGGRPNEHDGRGGGARPDMPPPKPDGPGFNPIRGPWSPDLDNRVIQLSEGTANLFNGAQTSSFYFTAWSRTGKVLGKSTNAPASLNLPDNVQRDSSIHLRMLSDRREALQFTEMGDCVLVGRYIGTDLAAMNRFAWWLFAAGAGIIALALAGAWWLATGAIRPIEHISSAASRIAAGKLAERINVTETESELGRLAGVLNNTFTQLEAAFAQQKQFTADASHELRTPITVLISEAQTALSRERSAAEYRDSLQTCLATAQQMRALARSLLDLARYDAGQESIKHEPVDLAEQARACADLIRPLANERGIVIQCSLASAATTGDSMRLRQVITNLLTNAVQYNRDRGEIHLITGEEDNHVFLRVSDSGAGIAPEDLPHVFKRFYRNDKARSTSTGRTGLGLAICKAIVDSHGGSIAADSRPGEGATFQMRLPKSNFSPGAKG